MTTPTQLFTLLDACFDAQNEATALWHSQEPEADDVAPDASASPETLLALVRAQHLRNFRLWHIEDTARRRDVTPTSSPTASTASTDSIRNATTA